MKKTPATLQLKREKKKKCRVCVKWTPIFRARLAAKGQQFNNTPPLKQVEARQQQSQFVKCTQPVSV